MKNRILIYDDNCPFCSWYSSQFIKYEFLGQQGRQAFSTLNDELISKIDLDKSQNEIPLLDISNNKVYYGIDALLEILDQKILFIKAIGNFAPIKWVLKKLYKLVSYNRKVIVAEKCRFGSFDCSPDLNYFYRFLFMAICLLFNTILLYPIHNIVFSKLSCYHLSFFQLQAAHFAFVAVNCILSFSFKKKRRYEYLGQVNMLALSVILLLIPLLIISKFIPELIIIVFLIAIAAFIFKEYVRRMEYTGNLLNNKWIVSMNLLSLCGFILFLFT